MYQPLLSRSVLNSQIKSQSVVRPWLPSSGYVSYSKQNSCLQVKLAEFGFQWKRFYAIPSKVEQIFLSTLGYVFSSPFRRIIVSRKVQCLFTQKRSVSPTFLPVSLPVVANYDWQIGSSVFSLNSAWQPPLEHAGKINQHTMGHVVLNCLAFLPPKTNNRILINYFLHMVSIDLHPSDWIPGEKMAF